MMVAYTGFLYLFGAFAPFVLVAVYAVAGIMIDVAPDRFLHAMPGGAEDADALPGKATVVSKTPRRHQRKR